MRSPAGGALTECFAQRAGRGTGPSAPAQSERNPIPFGLSARALGHDKSRLSRSEPNKAHPAIH